ncbi:MAG: HEAT repeat domain-containing protein [Planctomycetota bacterium]
MRRPTALNLRPGNGAFAGRFAVLAMLLCCGPVALAIDTVELSGGGRLGGRVKRVPSKSAVYVKIDSEMMVSLPESRVTRVVESSRLSEYRRRAAVADENPEAHYLLAIWCKKQMAESGLSLLAQYRYHMQRTIMLAPEHSKARAALGYVPTPNGWRLAVDVKRQQGMIRAPSGWTIPEVAALEKAKKAAEVQTKKWNREISKLRTSAMKGDPEAFATLQSIDDPLASEAVAKEFTKNTSQPRRLRELWLSLLGRFKTGPATMALVAAARQESDPVIREKAVSVLQSYAAGRSSAISSYLADLRSGSRRIVQAGARALQYFPDPELAFEYIDALVTEHIPVQTQSPEIQVGFGNDGSMASGMGRKEKPKPVPMRNKEALVLLQLIEPDVNYGYDEARWRQHFAHKFGSYEGDLRRDP